MGNKQCSCLSSNSPNEVKRNKHNRDSLANSHGGGYNSLHVDGSSGDASKLQHIRDREQIDELDVACTPSDHPQANTIFITKSNANFQDHRLSVHNSTSPGSATHKRRSSCSTIYLDDSTVSQPNIKASIKCVALAVFYHIKHREPDEDKHLPDIFDERLHPLSKERVPSDYHKREPDHRQIYRFIRTLFSAAQLTAECAIVTLIYLERLLTYAEICICPANWKRILLGAILLASKVWDDQAVWNVDYCQILKDISVEDMNEMERQFLELLNFNINVPSSVYAKYYFDLRELANNNSLVFTCEQLSKERARKLEATSRSCENKYRNHTSLRRTVSQDHLAGTLNTSVILS